MSQIQRDGFAQQESAAAENPRSRNRERLPLSGETHPFNNRIPLGTKPSDFPIIADWACIAQPVRGTERQRLT